MVDGVLSNGAKSNCSHMSIRTMKIKDVRNDKVIINNNVCSPISRSVNDDNQMVTEELDRHKFIGDKRKKREKDREKRKTIAKKHIKYWEKIVINTTCHYRHSREVIIIQH